MDWTARARELIRNREYRYLSPLLVVEKATRKIRRLKGAGLVHSPALHITALASQEDDMADGTDFMMRLAQLLDMPEDADQVTILETLAGRLKDGKPDPRKYVPAEAVQELMRELSKDRASTRQTRAETKVADAVTEGCLTPGTKDWALERCLADEGSFDQFMASSVLAFAYLTRQVAGHLPPGSRAEDAVSPEVVLLSEQLGIDPKLLT